MNTVRLASDLPEKVANQNGLTKSWVDHVVSYNDKTVSIVNAHDVHTTIPISFVEVVDA